MSDTSEPANIVASSAITDEYLLRRQMALQEEAREVLDELDLERRLDDLGSMLVTGSFISGLMVWRELDIMFLGGPELSPTDVLAAMGRLVVLPGVVRFDYADERGLRSPTGSRSTVSRPSKPGPLTPVQHGGHSRSILRCGVRGATIDLIGRDAYRP